MTNAIYKKAVAAGTIIDANLFRVVESRAFQDGGFHLYSILTWNCSERDAQSIAACKRQANDDVSIEYAVQSQSLDLGYLCFAF